MNATQTFLDIERYRDKRQVIEVIEDIAEICSYFSNEQPFKDNATPDTFKQLESMAREIYPLARDLFNC